MPSEYEKLKSEKLKRQNAYYNDWRNRANAGGKAMQDWANVITSTNSVNIDTKRKPD